jgi:hypothetical protein
MAVTGLPSDSSPGPGRFDARTPRAYWSAGIAPGPPREHRLPSGQPLVELVATRAVTLRGWFYPHMPPNEPPEGVAWLPDGGIEATTEWGQYHEVWRMHPSGLFSHRWRLREDRTAFSGTLHITAAIYTVAEIFEFCRRLYRDDETVTEVAIRVGLQGVLGRLASGDTLESLGRRAIRNDAVHSVALPRADLAGGILNASVDAADSLLGQLGFTDIARDSIDETAKRFLSGRI